MTNTTTTTLQYSTAIRLGAMVTGQAIGGDFIGEGDEVTACAEGAAALAAGCLMSDAAVPCVDFVKLDRAFPVRRHMAFDPITGVESLILNVVRCLNDRHGWTREKIADWVELEEVRLGFFQNVARGTHEHETHEKEAVNVSA